ncbi:MAG: hypothetical protein GXO23_07275 [Crenarchaeota archaeon]|nr:hypothetical protein [Thermoproteota archaeon]
MTRVRLYYLGRRRMYDMIRSVLYQDLVEVKYVDSQPESVDEDMLIIDRAFEKIVSRGRRVDSNVDIVQIMTMLTEMLSKILECQDVTVGVDPGDDVSGVAVVHCRLPTIHARLPMLKIIKLVQSIAELDNIDLKVCIGVKSSRRSRDRSNIEMLLSLSSQVPVYMIDEESTKYRRRIYSRRVRRLGVTVDEADATIFALSIDEGVRVSTR